MKQKSIDDPRGLIYEAYHMADISPSQCRSIFLDWALEPRAMAEMRAAAERLLQLYSPAKASHPMTEILQASLVELSSNPSRRGGHKARA